MLLKDRVRDLEKALQEIRDVANVSDGVGFYAMLADKALEGEYGRDTDA